MGIATDQQGQSRNDGSCDIGSFEFINNSTCYVINDAGGKNIIFCL
ncbi:MAG: choice-of-anchor Q domain-containing protein [Hyphomicrobiales bacterium]